MKTKCIDAYNHLKNIFRIKEIIKYIKHSNLKSRLTRDCLSSRESVADIA